ncbi:MAG: valine--tRNA ligase, partial [Erysipelotrichaceae bacterium]
PGMDHAGIATQAKVDARLKSEGISRYDIGREKFLDRAWEWKDEYAGHIREQWGKMGLSLDYSRERFTLDDGLSKAVNKVFIDLYNDGLIYQGERIINWDPVAKTALSNKVVESDEQLEVATTRPETMFGDVCVVVHPDDTKYQHLIGKHVINPANGDKLIIIADDYIEIGFGTGAMKCTPAHDPNDFAISERHNLPKIICMNPDGTMNDICGEFANMDRFECRKALVKKLESDGNLVSIKKHLHQVGHSERTNAIVEPYLSKQWFVKMKPLAKEVLDNQANEDEKINFYPPRFEKTFTSWLDNIEDWCISRQLWWGHRIPAWYHNTTNEIYVGETAPKDIENWHQDEDVLDTWFSSALWPFSTLGWPNTTEDLERYFPNDVLVTGYDIIFFWVARMAFQTRYCMKSRPFKDVLIHGLVRDEQGRKMSKSLGNGIDPMEIIEKYGCDSLRFFLTTNSTPGADLRFTTEKVEASWNFINKIWNATRFVMMNIPEDFTYSSIDLSHVSMIDCWILKRLDEVIANVNINMDKYEFALVGNELYSFIWNDFCSWYIEFAKAGLNSDDAVLKLATQSTLLTLINAIVVLIHPFMPFVSEEIYLSIPHRHASINLEAWPTATNIAMSDEQMSDIANMITMIEAIREIKLNYHLKPSYEIDVCIKDNDGNVCNISEDIKAILAKMCHATIINSIEGEAVVRPLHVGSLSVAIADIVNIEEEIIKLEADLIKLEQEIKRGTAMLSNTNFVAKAPAAKIEAEQTKLTNYKNQYEIVAKQLLEMKNK